MNGLYDILESYRIQDPRFTYEGLYQDAPRKDTIYGSGRIKEYPYGLNSFPYKDINPQRQAFLSSAFPQEYGVGSLFDPRVGKPEQSLSYNEPYFINAPQDFSQPIADPFQTDYPITRAIQEEKENVATDIMQQPLKNLDFDTSFGVANEEDEEQVDYLSGQPKSFKDSNTLQEYFQNRNPISGIMNLFSKIPTPFNLARRGLESLRGANQRLRNTDFGQSKTLQEYFQKVRERKQAERAREANAAVYKEASDRGFTNDRGGFSTNRADRAGTSIGSGQFSPSTSRGRSGY